MTRALPLLLVLAVPPVLLAAPALKPNETRVLYVSGDDLDRQIYVVKPDGTGAEKLTSGEGNHFFPAWSPDGKKIAFTIEDKARRQHVYVMDADGKNPKPLTKDGGPNRGPAWSPDGKQIAITRWTGAAYNVFVMDADGGNLTNLTNSNQ